jgi:hypothetical protein
MEMLDEEIQSAVADQSVTGTANYALWNVFLTFEIPTLPSITYIECGRVAVELYVPNLMHCFQCHAQLYVVCAMTLSKVRLHVPTHHTVVPVLEVMHPMMYCGLCIWTGIATRNCWPRKACFSFTQGTFFRIWTKHCEPIICFGFHSFQGTATQAAATTTLSDPTFSRTASCVTASTQTEVST